MTQQQVFTPKMEAKEARSCYRALQCSQKGYNETVLPTCTTHSSLDSHNNYQHQLRWRCDMRVITCVASQSFSNLMAEFCRRGGGAREAKGHCQFAQSKERIGGGTFSLQAHGSTDCTRNYKKCSHITVQCSLAWRVTLPCVCGLAHPLLQDGTIVKMRLDSCRL